MSDIDMDTSPRSNSSSESEKPPTPGYQNEDGHEEDDNYDSEGQVEKNKKGDSVHSKSPSGCINEESGDETGDGSVSHQGNLSDDQEVEETTAVPHSDLSVKGSSISSPKGERSVSEKSNELDKEEQTAENEGDSGGNISPRDHETNETDKGDLLSEATDTKEPKLNHDKNQKSLDKTLHEKQSLPKVGGGHVDDGDLLQISDLSVDLTGDEAAIVEDILQNAGDGELIPSTTAAEEKLIVGGNVEKPDPPKVASPPPSKKHDEQEEGGGTGELFNDIFGSSDEDEEFEGFEQEEVQRSKKSRKKTTVQKKPVVASDEEDDQPSKTDTAQDESETPKESLVVPPPADESSDDEDDDEGRSQIFISDFDLMMQHKKEENRRSRKRKNVDIINDSDDLVVGLIKRMQEAAQEDKLANEARQAATKKLMLLPVVMKHMLKIDLMVTFLDCNVLPVLKEWISPLPDGSLPHLQIREGVLKILKQLPPVDSGALKVSGIGKAVMYLFRHPKETRKNKECAGKLISEWSRPIFGVTANFKSMTREEREERDYANMSKRRRLSSDHSDGGKTPKRIETAIKSESKGLRPGDKGWCMRARVPAPSNKDYVVRPKSNIGFVDFSKVSSLSLISVETADQLD